MHLVNSQSSSNLSLLLIDPTKLASKVHYQAIITRLVGCCFCSRPFLSTFAASIAITMFDDSSDEDGFGEEIRKQMKRGNDEIDHAVSLHVHTVQAAMIGLFSDNEIDHRVLPREKRVRMDHGRANDNLWTDYIGPDPIFAGREFEVMFRISRSRFQRLMEDMKAARIPFFADQPVDRKGETGASLACRLLLPLKTMAYGVPPHTFRDYFQMSTSLARECCIQFDMAIKRLYQKEYLRIPTTNDLKSICKLHKAVHGVDGMFGSLDCTHAIWKNCPTAWQGSYKGKEKTCTIVLEALCDYQLWFWHAAFGYAGTMNDSTILNLSPLLESFVDGSFDSLERDVVPYDIAGNQFNNLFILVDGIYPQYSRFVKSFKVPVTEREKKFSEWQEACRKDIERAFGVLQGRWQSMQRPFHQLNLDLIGNRVCCCLILHNMCVSDRVMGGDVHAWYDPSESIVDINNELCVAFENPEDVARVQTIVPPNELARYGLGNGETRIISAVTNANRWSNLQCVEEHKRLREAISDVTEVMTHTRLQKKSLFS